MQTTFPGTLGRLRKEKRLSQRKVAQDLCISQALLSHYENGIREPGLDFINRVCTYYDVTADYLLGRTGDPVPPSYESLLALYDHLCRVAAADATGIISLCQTKKQEEDAN